MARVAMPIQDGRIIDYVNTTENAIAVGDVVTLTNLCGIAETDIAAGETGAVALCGVYSFPATTTAAFAVGDKVYWDGSAAAAEGDTLLGVCVETKETATATAYVKIGFIE